MQSQNNVKHQFACNNTTMVNKCLHAITTQWETSVCMQSQNNVKHQFACNNNTMGNKCLHAITKQW